MKPPPPIDDQTQRRRFAEAIRLLGGFRATERAIGINERNLRKLLSGDQHLHDGILRDMAAALIDHAEKCRLAERGLSPAFAGNLTERQRDRQGKPDARRRDHAPSSREAIGRPATLSSREAAGK